MKVAGLFDTEEVPYNASERLSQYLDHLIHCADDKQEGFDVYQMLAFRRMEALMKQVKAGKDFEQYAREPVSEGCWQKTASWVISTVSSEYTQAMVAVIIIGLLQTFGITLILARNMTAYFYPNEFDVLPERTCEIGSGHWADFEPMYKLLAFLFCAMISMNLGQAIRIIRTNGFNMVIAPEKDGGIRPEDFGLVGIADVMLIQTGALINFYALLICFFGSFFLIYASEDVANSLDMVFNAMALFFLTELDDLLVQNSDYEDVAKYAKMLKEQAFEDRWSRVETAVQAFEDTACCRLSCVKRYVVCAYWFQRVLKVIIFVAAVVGPLVVALCW